MDEYVPGIVLPELLGDVAPVVEDDLAADYSDEPELRQLDAQQRRYEEYVSGGGGLRVFLGNPLERDRDARLSLPSNVEGLIWDASGLALEDEDDDPAAGQRRGDDEDDDDEFPALDENAAAVPLLQMPVLRQVGVQIGTGPDDDAATATAPPSAVSQPPHAPAREAWLPASGSRDDEPADDLDDASDFLPADDDDNEPLLAEEAPEHGHDGALDAPFERIAFSPSQDEQEPPVRSLSSRGAPPLDSGTFDDPNFSGADAVRRAFPQPAGATLPPTPGASAFDEEETQLGQDALGQGDAFAAGPQDEAPTTDWRRLAALAQGQHGPDDSGWTSSPTQPVAPAPTARSFDTAEGWFTKPPVVAAAPVAEPTTDDDTGPSADRLDEEAELQSRTPAPLTTTNGSRIQWQRLNKSGASTADASKAALSNKVALATEDRTLPSFRTYEPTAEPDVVKGAAKWGWGAWALAVGLVILVLGGVVVLIVGIGQGQGAMKATAPSAVTAPAARAPAVAPLAVPGDATPGDATPGALPAADGLDAAPAPAGADINAGAGAPAAAVVAGADLASAAQADAEKAQERIRVSGLEAGMVTVTSNVPAVVTIEGKVIGTTPIRMYSLAPGTYDVRAVAQGQTRVITSRVDAGRVMGLRFDF